MDTVTKHGIPKMGQPGSNRTEEPDNTNRMKQSMAIVTTMTEQPQNIKSNDPDPEHGSTPISSHQEKPDPANSAAAQPTQNSSCDDADNEGKLETRLTSERRNGDDGKDEATSDSSRSTYDTPGNEGPKGVPENGDSDKHGAPRGLGSETCGKFCIQKSKVGPHKQHTWNIDNENGEKLEKETKGNVTSGGWTLKEYLKTR